MVPEDLDKWVLSPTSKHQMSGVHGRADSWAPSVPVSFLLELRQPDRRAGKPRGLAWEMQAQIYLDICDLWKIRPIGGVGGGGLHWFLWS